jgi:hypothetical protein
VECEHGSAELFSFPGLHPMAYPTDEQIRIRAHELWELAGKPEGKDNEFWHLAERGLQEKPEPSEPTPEHSEATMVPSIAL